MSGQRRVHLTDLQPGRRERRLRARRRRGRGPLHRAAVGWRRSPALGGARQRQRLAELQPRRPTHRVHVGTRRPSGDLHDGRRRHERRSAHAARVRGERVSREPRLVSRRSARRVSVADRGHLPGPDDQSARSKPASSSRATDGTRIRPGRRMADTSPSSRTAPARGSSGCSTSRPVAPASSRAALPFVFPPGRRASPPNDPPESPPDLPPIPPETRMIRRTTVLVSRAPVGRRPRRAAVARSVAAPTPVATQRRAANADSLAALRARQRADSIAAAERAAREAAAASDRRSAGELGGRAHAEGLLRLRPRRAARRRARHARREGADPRSRTPASPSRSPATPTSAARPSTTSRSASVARRR